MQDNPASEIRTETVSLSVSDGTAMPAYVAWPSSGGAQPGLMVFQEAFGVNHHIRDVTERFAQAGYVAIAPALYHRTDPAFEGAYTDFSAVAPHMQAITDEGLAADVRAAYDWLTSAAGGNAPTVGAIGYCLGGRVAFLTNATVPLRAAASYYGGGIGPGGRRPDLLARVPDLHGPILLVWGGKDAHIGPDQTRPIEDALRAAGKPYEVVTFSEADHGFFCDERAAYNADAARQIWPLTLAFFENHLRG